MAEQTEEYEYEYCPLAAGDCPYQHRPEKCNTQTFRRLDIFLWLLSLEIVNIVLFVGGSIIISHLQDVRQGHFDNYARLREVNKMWDYKNMSANIAGASYRDESWEDMIIHHGIVTVSEEWAARQGLSVSAATPDSLGDMVYQLDGFHSMHCLYIVREHVLGAINGNHTHHIHHCLDYIRKTLMCNMDVTLSALDEKDLFNAESNYGVHECRDYEAITKWAKANEWKELPEWLATHD